MRNETSVEVGEPLVVANVVIRPIAERRILADIDHEGAPCLLVARLRPVGLLVEDGEDSRALDLDGQRLADDVLDELVVPDGPDEGQQSAANAHARLATDEADTEQTEQASTGPATTGRDDEQETTREEGGGREQGPEAGLAFTPVEETDDPETTNRARDAEDRDEESS